MTFPEIVFYMSTALALISIGFGFASTTDRFYNKLERYNLVLLGLAISGVVIMIVSGIVYNDEKQQILTNTKQNSKSTIDSWSCDDLGENVLVQIKNDNSTLLDYQKDLYHFKCEVKP